MHNVSSSTETPAIPSPLDAPGSRVVFRYEKNGYRIYESIESGLMFVHPQPEAAELNRLYSEAFFARGNKYAAPGGAGVVDPQLENDGRKLKLVQEFCAGGRLLDVGSATGGFLRVALAAGFAVEGLEVSDYGADRTERELGVKVHRSDLPAARLESAAYDVVTMWDVIEHLRDLHETIAEIARILRPGGVLLVATGDIGSPYARLMGRRWHLLTPPLHLFYFTEKSLRKLLARHGLDTESIRRPGKSASLDFVLFKARESFGRPADWLRSLCSRVGLSRRRLYLNLGDIMIAAARKPAPPTP